MSITRWIVTVSNCDDKPEVLACLSSEDKAKDFIKEDMKDFVEDQLCAEDLTIDETHMIVTNDGNLDAEDQFTRRWNYQKIEIDCEAM